MNDSAVRAPHHPDTAPTRRDPRKAEFEVDKLRKRLRRLVGQAIADFAMIDANDRVMVCMSGGKDSYAMLDILQIMKLDTILPYYGTRAEALAAVAPANS